MNKRIIIIVLSLGLLVSVIVNIHQKKIIDNYKDVIEDSQVLDLNS